MAAWEQRVELRGQMEKRGKKTQSPPMKGNGWAGNKRRDDQDCNRQKRDEEQEEAAEEEAAEDDWEA